MTTLQHINEQFIEELAISMHEPRWLRQERIRAWERFQELPDPDWKRSKIPKVDLQESFILREQKKGEMASLKIEKKTPSNASGKIVLVDGDVLRISLNPELARKGVIFCDMKTAVLERADLLEKFWNMKSKQDKFHSFQTALWQNGYFLFIPQGLVVEEPFQVQVIQREKVSILSQHMIIMDTASKATVEEVSESEAETEEIITHFNSTVIQAEPESNLKYYQLQNWSQTSYDYSFRNFFAKKNAHIKSLNSILGASAGNIETIGEVLDLGATIEHDGITIGNDQQQFKISATMNHQAERTKGLMRYKGILKDRSYSYLDGLIKVVQQGKKANSRLEEHTLILGDRARCDALPALDIQTSDVNVSHSASVTKADQEKIFYAMSRGLSEEDARNLIVQGFFEDLLQIIQNPSWYEKIKQMIEAKLSLSHHE